MPRIGLSKPYFAIYSNDGPAVSYSGGGLMGKYTQLNMSLNDSGSDNNFYADNGIDETGAAQFAGGTLGMTTNNLLVAISQKILGTQVSSVTGIQGLQTVGAKWEHYDDRQSAPFLGVGGIYKHQVGGQIKYQAVIFPKVKCTTPSQDATTQGDSIEWQVDEITAQINRDDTPNHEWRRVSSLLDSEQDAEILIKAFLNIQDEPVTPAAQLTGLTIGTLALSPAFNAFVDTYEAATENAADVITAAGAEGVEVAITVNGDALTNGQAATWTPGENTVAITASGDGMTSTVYTVTVTADE